MKSFLLIFTFILMSTTAFAERFKDRFHSIEEGSPGEESLLYLESGRVVFLSPERSRGFVSVLEPGAPIEIVTGKRNTVKAILSLPEEAPKSAPEPEPEGAMSVDPTILPDHATALTIFRGMNNSWKSKTECTDRAHVWSYEEWKKRGLIQKKVFLFFTQTYIRRYRYHWWFHVSPYTFIQHDNEVVEHVMDRRYTRAPLHMKTWTDIFIRSKRSCPESTYRHYRNNRYGTEHCYIVKADMYYRLPLHVRNLEDSGIVKTRFSTSEVNFSYRAFRRRGVR